MNEKFKLSLESLVPFLLLGIAIALAVGFFILFSYVLVWGLLIGAVLWAVYFIKNLFLPGKKMNNNSEQTQGRIIEHTDED